MTDTLQDRMENWLRDGTPADFDAIVSDYSLPEAVTELMKRDPSLEAQAEVADRLLGAECLERKPREIKTIGVFYYRAFSGGIERVMARLITLWTEAGYRVVLLTDQPPHPDDYPLPEGVKRFQLPDTFGLSAKTRRLRFSRIREILIKEKVDAFVNHAWLSRNLLWDMLAVKPLGIPYIVYTHGPFSCLLAEGNLGDMDEITLLPRINQLPDLVISLSRTFDAFWSRFSRHTRVLLDPCVLPPASGERAERKPHQILWVGRMAPVKRPLDAIRILAEVRRQVPDATLALLGGTDPMYDDLEQQAHRLAEELEVADAVDFAGFQSNVWPYYQASDLLLSTAVHEGFGLNIAEAKQEGLPCVLYDLPYLFFSEQGQGMFPVPQGSVRRAGAEIVRLLQDPAALKAAGEEARRSASVFSDSALMTQWKEIFAELGRAPEAAEKVQGMETTLLSMLLDHTHTGLQLLGQQSASLRQSALDGLLNSVYDARFYVDHHQDMTEIYGFNQMLLLKHFIEHGMAEGRQACPEFNVAVYRANYPDLEQAYGNDLIMYYLHYMIYGKAEGRKGC